MRRIAEPLLMTKRGIRFRSLLNFRIFSLIRIENKFELVELENNDPHAFLMRTLYQGNDEDLVKAIIVKEVCDVCR